MYITKWFVFLLLQTYHPSEQFSISVELPTWIFQLTEYNSVNCQWEMQLSLKQEDETLQTYFILLLTEVVFFFKHRAIIMLMGRGNALIDVFWSVLITLCFFFLIIGFCAREADIWLPWLSVGTHPGKFYTHYYSYTWLIWNYPVQTSLHNRSEYLILFTYFDVCVKTNNKKAFQTLLLINQIEILSWFNFFLQYFTFTYYTFEIPAITKW